tara:strand:- start:158 stop:439 length:282 start_codon:yes stop_codon:yes gene_type:complete
MRYFKEEPLEHFYNNRYTKEEKLQIVLDLWEDYENGLLSQETIAWIVNNKRFGDFSCRLIIQDMLKKGIIKKDFTGNFTTEELLTIGKKEYDL